MQFLKFKLKELLYISIIFLLINLVYTFLIYFKILNLGNESLRTVTYITGLLVFLIYGLISGIIEKKKGWIAGLSSSILMLLIIFIFNLIFKNTSDFNYFIKIITYLLCGIIGGILGVNFKNN